MKTLRRLVLPLLLLAACTSQTPVAPPSAPPAAVSPADWYLQAASEGKKVYAIDSAQSLITVVVRRGGPMARFGHDHVVASRAVTGFAAPDAGRADFQFRLDALTVDEEALRNAAGLTTQPDADAIAGTRNNMLTRVLEAQTYPLVLLHAQRSAPGAPSVRLTVTLHGVSKTLDVPVKFEESAGRLAASGAFTLLQTDFGITPMSVLGGAMRVEDQMELQFRIVAR
jgi:polyisoprenoid-binding protein YceI